MAVEAVNSYQDQSDIWALNKAHFPGQING